jgi:CheY-like chemotaxis protein
MALTKIDRNDDSKPGPKQGVPDSEKPLILYVEDDDTNADLAQAALSEKYRVMRARTSKEAFRFLSEHNFDLILMDIELSGSNLNGIEITQVLKKIPDAPQAIFSKPIELGGTPIIFVTAYSARYTKKELMSAGGDDLVTKPVDFTRLSLAMSRMMVRNAFSKPSQTTPPLSSARLATAAAQVSAPDPVYAGAERRSFERKSKVLPCKLHVDGMMYMGQTLDISPGGVKLCVDTWDASDRFPMGSEFEMSLEPIWGDMNIRCKVTRMCENNPYTVGVAFVNTDDEKRKKLQDWLYG